MTRTAYKPMKPTKMWAIIDKRGMIVDDASWHVPAIGFEKDDILPRKDQRIAHVLITELPTKRKGKWK